MDILFTRQEHDIRDGLITACRQVQRNPQTLSSLTKELKELFDALQIPGTTGHQQKFIDVLQRNKQLHNLSIAAMVIGLNAIASYKPPSTRGRPIGSHNKPRQQRPMHTTEVA